ncbi:class I SAM-dependent methyltransferase [Alcanivorax sp.]|uniref:class I SAM-dependent methyltransferase n=1 Tax=Alcanivorax sp. TaxID=1872427 RepID=UPI000C4152CA|nr:class I SAM-dependent methyltransferase [Alcanivorax sp.]MBQ23963.1 SAM-dependent methyltransferase [Alcanivorax sp.]
MNGSTETPDNPSTLWKSVGGRNWVESQRLIDHLFKPIEGLLAKAVECQSPQRVLDIGCGTGGTTRAISRYTRSEGQATGVDISEVMIEAARQAMKKNGAEKAGAEFICADAQTFDFGESQYDMLVSRFGIMFFEDPIKAFQNLRRAAAKDAPGLFVAWRSPQENPFMTAAARAAKSMVTLPQQAPDAPGQFAFADAKRVESILDSAGWNHISIEPLDFECTFPESKLVGYFTRLGPLGRVFPDLDEKTQARLITVVRDAFEPFVFGDTVKFNAACWQIKARA